MPASAPRQLIGFLLMSLFWGLTWTATKLGVAVLPPAFFAALRFLAAGLIMAALGRFALGAARAHWGRTLVAALLINTGCYSLIFWGIARVPTGIAAIVNLSIIPLALFLLGLALREERFSWRKLIGVGMGLMGLLLLFWPRLTAAETADEAATLWGMLAIVVGTLSYCLGSILSRPLLRAMPPLTLAALHNLIGGLGLLVLSLLGESWAGITLEKLLLPEVLWSWIFMVLCGSVIAFTVFLNLLRDWGPAKAGLYSFVSPVVAVAVGLLVFHEPFGFFEAIGSIIMLAAAGVALTDRQRSLQGSSAAARSLDCRANEKT